MISRIYNYDYTAGVTHDVSFYKIGEMYSNQHKCYWIDHTFMPLNDINDNDNEFISEMYMFNKFIEIHNILQYILCKLEGAA